MQTVLIAIDKMSTFILVLAFNGVPRATFRGTGPLRVRIRADHGKVVCLVKADMWGLGG